MRVTNGWNGLSNDIISARKTSEFKARLDAFTAARTLVKKYGLYSWEQKVKCHNSSKLWGLEGCTEG